MLVTENGYYDKSIHIMTHKGVWLYHMYTWDRLEANTDDYKRLMNGEDASVETGYPFTGITCKGGIVTFWDYKKVRKVIPHTECTKALKDLYLFVTRAFEPVGSIDEPYEWSLF